MNKPLDPIALTAILLVLVLIGSTFQPIEPIVFGVLLLIILGLLMMGYGNIHNTLKGIFS